MPPTTQTITSTIGLEVTGMTVDQFAAPHAAQEAQRALDEHGVVVYREAHLSDDELLAFSRRLGTLVVQPTGEHRHPEIQTITLDPAKTNALLASYRQGNFQWHVDGATVAVPQKASYSPRARSIRQAATPSSPTPTRRTRPCPKQNALKSLNSVFCIPFRMRSRWLIPTPPRNS